MVHSITNQTESGYSTIEVTQIENEKVRFSILSFDFDNFLQDSNYIDLDKNQYYSIIGTLHFVQSKIRSNEK
jgi:hypothetical protein